MKQGLRQYLVFICGVFICALGIGFISRAALGTSPLSSVSFVLSLATPLKMGTYTFVCNMLFLGLEAVLRRRIGWYQVLQVAATLLFSLCIDFALWLIPSQLNGPLAMKILFLAIGCPIMALGIALEVFGGVLMLPGEGIVKALAEKSGHDFGNVKVAFDCVLTLVAAGIALAAFGRLNGVGVGTVVSALAVGQFVKLYGHKLVPFRDWVRQ